VEHFSEWNREWNMLGLEQGIDIMGFKKGV
jgi:hypothetical protein